MSASPDSETSRVSKIAGARRRWLLVAGGLLALVVVAALGVSRGWFGRSPLHRSNPLLETPSLVLEKLQGRPLYFNGPAYTWLVAQRSDLLAPETGVGRAAQVEVFAQAALEPKLFRQLDRQFRFEALLFLGDPTQSRPLLEHLAETKDWSLSYVDHMGMVFRRAAGKAWKMEDLDQVRARFVGTPAWVRATMLAQTAVRLVAAHDTDAAKRLLDEAMALDQKVPDVWSGLASYHMQRGEYSDAFLDADRALAIDENHLPSLSTKTHLLYATKQFSAAYDLSKRLVARVPDDPNLLFYHAKIAHEAHAYQAEVDAMKKIIAQAQAAGRPVSGYQMYLGQAYMTLGDARKAIDVYMDVLNDPDLPQDQRDFARESIARMKKRTGL